jgi:hypothetical protein
MHTPKLAIPLLAIPLTVVAMALSAGAAVAGQSPAVADCNAHDQLTRHYTAAQLRTALSTMNADVKEYTDCYDVIERQLLNQLAAVHRGGPSSSAGGGGSFLPTPLIVVLGVLLLAAAGLAISAVRGRRGSSPGPAGGPNAP